MKSHSVLITGFNGFIASHLIPQLALQGHAVKATIHKSFDCLEAFPANATPVRVGAIHGETDWSKALCGIDVVVHLAARAHILKETVGDSETEFFTVNALGTANLVNQAIQAGIKHFVLMSSVGAIATLSRDILDESSICQPDTPYGRSKLQAEKLLQTLARGSNLAWTILRPTLVYGPGNPGNMARLIHLVQQGLPLPFGSIQNRRSFLYVENLTDAISICIGQPKVYNQTFIVSDSQDLSTPELTRKIADCVGKKSYLLPVHPQFLRQAGIAGDVFQHWSGRSAALNSNTINRLIGSLLVDSSHFRKALSWQPPYTIDEGLTRTLNSNRMR